MHKRFFRAQRRHLPRVGYAAIAGLLGVSAITGIHQQPEDRVPTPAEAAEMLQQPELPSFLAAFDSDAVETAATEAAADQIQWDLANIDHPRVDYWVERFMTDKRDQFERFLTRQGKYEEMITAKLEERDMPRDLIYLAMIESGFQEKAYSSADASGIWQFIAPTARRYGLDINRAVDERNDPARATDAALDYLSDLHDRFDSWYLAAASYNTGENRVGRIMRQETGSERGEDADYYRIWDRLPRETRDYVPLMIAAARIAKDPARYGFDHVEPLPPVVTKSVTAAPATPLSRIAKDAGLTVGELKKLNPQLKLNRTRNDQRSVVRVPA
ncbi:MAG: lytic transglycosylase domain-containing protein [Thermoanaerobaculia bacterium]